MKALLALLAVTAVALAGAISASADPPTVRYFTDTFVGVNPCTGELDTVTIDVTQYLVNGNLDRATHVVTTSSGFVGRGEETEVLPGDNIFSTNDIVFNQQTGERAHAQLIAVANPATGDLQVLRQMLTCIPPG
jgi:hypothetical protein